MKVVFIHGLMGSRRNFKYLASYFDDAVSFDLPGFGRAAKPRVKYDKEYFLKFLETKIKEPCVLVGHSLGSILAKDFALKHPKLVKKLFLISYPLQRSPENFIELFRESPMSMMYLNNTWLSRMICHTKVIWKWIFLPFDYLKYGKYFASVYDTFLHTNHSLTSTIQETLLKDDWREIAKVKDKAIFIYGEKEKWLDRSLISDYKSYQVKGMGHQFFHYEQEIAKIIKSNF